MPKPGAPAIVREAIRLGYRHLDGACDYGNEPQVGEGIAAALKDRLCLAQLPRPTGPLDGR
jgi:D-xylose reductase